MASLKLKNVLDQILADNFTKTPVKSKLFRVVIPDLERGMILIFPKTSKKMFVEKTEHGYKVECYRLCDFDIQTNFYQFDPKEETATEHLKKYKEVKLDNNGMPTIHKAYYYIPRYAKATIEGVADMLNMVQPVEGYI